MIEIELRRLHRCFNYFLMRRFQIVFDQINHDIDSHVFYQLIKYCEQCQRYNCFSKRFVCIIKNDVDFNFNLIIDILYINNKSVFHIIDETIRF